MLNIYIYITEIIAQKIRTYWKKVGEHQKVLDKLNIIAPKLLQSLYSS